MIKIPILDAKLSILEVEDQIPIGDERTRSVLNNAKRVMALKNVDDKPCFFRILGEKLYSHGETESLVIDGDVETTLGTGAVWFEPTGPLLFLEDFTGNLIATASDVYKDDIGLITVEFSVEKGFVTSQKLISESFCHKDHLHNLDKIISKSQNGRKHGFFRRASAKIALFFAKLANKA